MHCACIAVHAHDLFSLCIAHMDFQCIIHPPKCIETYMRIQYAYCTLKEGDRLVLCMHCSTRTRPFFFLCIAHIDSQCIRFSMYPILNSISFIHFISSSILYFVSFLFILNILKYLQFKIQTFIIELSVELYV